MAVCAIAAIGLFVFLRSGTSPGSLAIFQKPAADAKAEERKPAAKAARTPPSQEPAAPEPQAGVPLQVDVGSAGAPMDRGSPDPGRADVAEPDRLPNEPIAAPEVLATSSPIYSNADPGVVPPALVRPQLPSEPPADVPPDHIGTVDIVVSPTGTVEHVRLMSPANRFRERMILAAVKAWRFRPATKGGEPVRYRLRVRLTV